MVFSGRETTPAAASEDTGYAQAEQSELDGLNFTVRIYESLGIAEDATKRQ
jgi:hypothetical protein